MNQQWLAHYEPSFCSAGDPAYDSSGSASASQLVTYSSLPPMPPAPATTVSDPLPPRQRSIKWPVAAAGDRPADQPCTSPGRPTLQAAAKLGPTDTAATLDQVRGRSVLQHVVYSPLRSYVTSWHSSDYVCNDSAIKGKTAISEA